MSYDRLKEKSGRSGPRYGNSWRKPRRPMPRKTPCEGSTGEATNYPKSCRRQTRLQKIREAKRALEERAR